MCRMGRAAGTSIVVALSSALAFAACGGSPLTPTDASTPHDVQMESAPEAGARVDGLRGDVDAPLERRRDASGDVAVDGRADAVIDAPPDVAVETPSHVAVDAPLDVAVDAPPDVVLDAPPGVAPDALHDGPFETLHDANSDLTPTIGACVIHDATIPLGAPGLSAGEQWILMDGVLDLATLQTACVGRYEEILENACLAAFTNPVEYDIVLFAGDVPIDWACFDDDCTPHTCGTGGSCSLRGPSNSLPPWSAPDVGADYVRKRFDGVGDFGSLAKVCTQSVFDELTALFCEPSRGQSGVTANLELDIYRPEWNDWSGTSCLPGTQCASVTCP
jgi:hypothetical protein